MLPAKAFETPAHTRHEGAGHASLPSTEGSGMIRFERGTTHHARRPATPNSCA